LFFLWILSGEESVGFNQENGKETEERKGKESKKLVPNFYGE